MWGIGTDTACLMCPGGNESRDHLFAMCSFSRYVFATVMRKICLFPEALTWQDQLQWVIRAWSGSSDKAKAGRLLWRLSLNYIWREMNIRQYGSKHVCSPVQIVKKIKDERILIAQNNQSMLSIGQKFIE
ncbi:unnamed protein product [Linum trigynum]|uniref:Reverse transcriptase zinc-binding domain-containing protein n=1 Tax=Linum trigynum TaxID=586398 RepID=A0AAV2FXP6_9ROSI